MYSHPTQRPRMPTAARPAAGGPSQYVTEQTGLRLAGEVARRGRSSVTWRMVREPKPSDIKLVHGTIVSNPLKQVGAGRGLQQLGWERRRAQLQRLWGATTASRATPCGLGLPAADGWPA